MSKYTFENGAPNVLNETMTYGKFLDLMTDAWLEAGKYEQEPHRMFRRSLFYNLDKKVSEATPPEKSES